MSTTLPVPDADAGLDELQRALEAMPVLDQDATVARAAELAGEDLDIPPRALLDLSIRLMDLTTLEGTDTPETVRDLCAQAQRPDPSDESAPAVATVCVYSDLVAPAAEALAGSEVAVTGVAGAFPSGRAPLAVRMADVAAAVADGADEIDVVLDRGAYVSGRYDDVVGQVRGLREAAGDTRLKVILETAELGSITDVRDAAWLAMIGGADMVKTSTGKVPGGATPHDVLVMLEAAQAYTDATGRFVGVKASGGIRNAETARRYLTLVAHAAGLEWLTSDRFRFGASSLLDDLVARRRDAG
jgi:deoxyribose-phosphate aldolase